MSEDTTEQAVEPSDDAAQRLDRRELLAAVGATGLGAVAGCVGGDDAETPTEGTGSTNETLTETMTTARQTAEEQTDSIDERFGYTATAPDEEPPVEPDHTVDLQFRFVEGRGEIPEFYFQPTGLAIEPGDTVKFNMATPHHNVNAYHPAFGYTQRVPDGVPAFSSPILSGGDYWLYTFEEEGVHDVVCAPHEIFGMAGRIVVGEASGPGAKPVGEAPGGEEARAPEFTAGLVLSDEAMAPEAILDAGSVSWSDIAEENKRLLVAPTEEH